MDIKVGRYSNPEEVGYQGWVEDADKTWIAYVDLEGKLTVWLNRDKDGGVLTEKPDIAPE